MNSPDDLSTELNVLIVDDDEFFSDILKKIAEKSGCAVNCIHDGKEVISALVAYEPDVIFLDLVLPGIDGVEIIHGLARAECKAKLVLMSGLDKRTISSVSEVARQNNLEVLDAVHKPLEPDLVQKILQPLIESKNKLRQTQQVQQDTTRLGPQLLYEPEWELEGSRPDNIKWVRACLVWQMDDGQLFEMDNILADYAKPNLVKGLIAIVVSAASADRELMQSSGMTFGIKLPIPDDLLKQNTTPDFLDNLVKEVGMTNQSTMFEINESAVTDSSQEILDAMSRLKIKGFQLSVSVKDKSSDVLTILSKLPIDELTLNMNDDRFRNSNIDDTETQFQIGSLVSIATKAGLVTSAMHVINQQQISFAARCHFNKVSGQVVQKAGDIHEIIEFYRKNN